MNITSVSQAASSVSQAASSVSQAASGVSGADMVSMRMMASVRVLDMAQDVYSDIAAELLASMSAAITGLGNVVDMYV